MANTDKPRSYAELRPKSTTNVFTEFGSTQHELGRYVEYRASTTMHQYLANGGYDYFRCWMR